MWSRTGEEKVKARDLLGKEVRVSMPPAALEVCQVDHGFSNVRAHQNHLEGVLKQTSGANPCVSDSVGLWWDPVGYCEE